MAALRPRSGAATDAAVLDAIRRVPDTTRTALAAELGVTAVTITTSVKRLLADGLVVETGRARSTGGKPASLLRVNTASRWALGCTIEDDRVALVAMSMDGVLRFRAVVPLAALLAPALSGEEPASPTPPASGAPGASDVPSLAAGTLHELRAQVEDGRATCAGIGLTDLREDPATADAVRSRLEDLLRLSTVAGGAGLCAGLGSYWMGEQEEQACLTIHLGPSIDAVVLAGGGPVLPERPGAGTLDHVIVDPQGPPCTCGGRGCLHQTASLAADVRRAVAQGLGAELGLDPAGTRTITDHARLTEAAAHGHARAGRIVLDSARAIAIAIGNLIGPLGVQRVVLIGTSVSMAPQLYRDAVDAALRERPGAVGEHVVVTVSSVQPHPCSVGAAALALTAVSRA
ncbi:ROK family transcriptional regulator [Brachybacterium hainanense]|uniref:ROK family protein n=1 Tax=Brachybacterium hainanense TaxID=1541174 RepID=A0ABV6R6J7_9MICO